MREVTCNAVGNDEADLTSPAGENGNIGSVRGALGHLAAERQRDEATGRFLRTNTEASTTLARCRGFWAAVDAQKRTLVVRECADLGLGSDAPAAVLRLVGAHVEASLLRESLFLKLVEAGGPATRGGRQRALFPAYLSALTQEARLWQILLTLPKTPNGQPVGAGETFEAAIAREAAAS